MKKKSRKYKVCPTCRRKFERKFYCGEKVFDKLSVKTIAPTFGIISGSHVLDNRAYMLTDGRKRFANQLKKV